MLRLLDTALNKARSEDLLQYISPQGSKKILALGFGSAGCRILSQLEKTCTQIDSFAYVSCEEQDLDLSTSGGKLLIDVGFHGKNTPSHIRGVAHRYEKEIRHILNGASLVFLVSGLGGCTGSGLTPMVAKMAKEEGAFTVAITAMPYKFEKAKHFYAGVALRRLRETADAVMIIDNDILLSSGSKIPILDFYAMVNERISDALSKIIESSGRRELSVGLKKFVDTVAQKGYAVLSIGTSSSINRVEEATTQAVKSMYSVVDLDEASKAILYLVGDSSLSANDIATSISRLNTMMGRGVMAVHHGLSVNGRSNMTAILIASGFKTTKFDDYDPLSKALNGLEIDGDLECGLAEEITDLAQLE